MNDFDFDDLWDDEKFQELCNKINVEASSLKLMFETWSRISDLTPSERGIEDEQFSAALAELGIDITTLMVVSTKIASMRAESNQIGDSIEEFAEWASTWCSGYMLGYLIALIDKGEDPLAQLEAKLKKHKRAKPKRRRKRSSDTAVMAFPLKVRMAEVPPGVTSVSELSEFVMERSREIGENFTEIDSDWAPVLFVISEHNAALVGIQIPDAVQEKDVLFELVIPTAIKATFEPDDPPIAAAFLSESWTLEPGEETQEWFENRGRDDQIAHHPERVDTLAIVAADQDQFEFWTAKIHRDGEQPPGLGEWEQVGPAGELDDDEQTTGRIPTMLREILS